MGKEYVILSMLKEKKIDYLYQATEEKIIIPCPICQSEIDLCTITTNWICNSCKNIGNLLYFLQSNNGVPTKAKVYNPKREKKQILDTITRLIHSDNLSASNRKTLINLKEKTNKLIDYFEAGNSLN